MAKGRRIKGKSKKGRGKSKGSAAGGGSGGGGSSHAVPAPQSSLQQGTGVSFLSPDIRNLQADILSCEIEGEDGNDGDGAHYRVKVRGAPKRDTIWVVRKDEVSAIQYSIEFRTNENYRRKIFELAQASSPPPRYITDQVESIRLSDKIAYMALTCGNDYETARELPFKVHVYMVMEYYLSKSMSWLPPPSAASRILMPLKMYIDESAEHPFEIHNFEARLITASCEEDDKARQQPDDITGAHLLLAVAEYAMLEQVVGKDPRMGRSASVSVAALSTQIDALWCAYCWLTRNDSSERLEQIRKYVDCCFTDLDIIGYDHRSLLWCICCLYIQRCKDLRVLHPNDQESTNPTAIDRLVECAKTLVEVRDDCPHSYFVAAYLLMDTQGMCRPKDCAPRYQQACTCALKSLDLAKTADDPYYLFQCHILVAYWKMTTAYKQPISQREIMSHVKKADKFRLQCQSYRVNFDLSRGIQTRETALELLASFKENNPTWEFDDVMDGPFTLAPWEIRGTPI